MISIKTTFSTTKPKKIKKNMFFYKYLLKYLIFNKNYYKYL